MTTPTPALTDTEQYLLSLWDGTPEDLAAAVMRLQQEAVAAHVRDTGCERLDWERLRREKGWPTPHHMRRTADALDQLTRPARYGDVLRWVADLCDAALAAPAASPEDDYPDEGDPGPFLEGIAPAASPEACSWAGSSVPCCEHEDDLHSPHCWSCNPNGPRGYQPATASAAARSEEGGRG